MLSVLPPLARAFSGRRIEDRPLCTGLSCRTTSVSWRCRTEQCRHWAGVLVLSRGPDRLRLAFGVEAIPEVTYQVRETARGC